EHGALVPPQKNAVRFGVGHLVLKTLLHARVKPDDGVRAAHGFLRNSKRTTISLSIGSPFWVAGSKCQRASALEEASDSRRLPSEYFTRATLPRRSMRASSSTELSESVKSTSGKGGSG